MTKFKFCESFFERRCGGRPDDNRNRTMDQYRFKS